MSGFAASLMSTPYLATNQRISPVLRCPPRLDATMPAKAVSACLGNRYCGSTERRSGKAATVSEEVGGFYRRGACRGIGLLPRGEPLWEWAVTTWMSAWQRANQLRQVRQPEQQQADQAARQRAVDADVLQVLADVQLHQLRHLLRIPALHRVADMLRHELRHLGRQRVRPVLKPPAQGCPQRRI